MTINIDYFSDKDKGKYISRHWAYSKTGDGLESIVLSGVIIIDQKGESENTWKAEQVSFNLPIRVPNGKAFKLKHWAPFITINSIYNKSVSNDSGHAVDGFRIINPENAQIEYITVQADIAIRDSDAWLYRLGYNVTLIGEYIDYQLPDPD